MRHADTYAPHLSAPYVGYVPDETHVSRGESLPRRSVQAPYAGLVARAGLQWSGYQAVAACHCSWGYRHGVLVAACIRVYVILQRDGEYGPGRCLLLCVCRRQTFDSPGYAVSLPRLALTIPRSRAFPRVLESVLPGPVLPACSNVPFPWQR